MKSPAKITVEAVTAYRTWFVAEDGTLHALFDAFEWPVREPAEADHFGAVDGFHAFRRPSTAWQNMGELYDEAPHLYLAVGAVAMWGQFETDDSGEHYRSSRAYPLTLWTTWDEETNRRSRLAAARYGVELMPRPLEAFDPTPASESVTNDDLYADVPAY